MFRPHITSAATTIADLVRFVEHWKTAALSMLAGTAPPDATVSLLPQFLNPVDLLAFLAATEQLHASAAAMVDAVMAGREPLSALDIFVLDTLETRAAQVASVEVGAIHSALHLTAPSAAADTRGVAMMGGPLRGCQGTAQDRWLNTSTRLVTAWDGHLYVPARKAGTLVVWPLMNCTDAFSGLPLEDVALATLAAPGATTPVSPLTALGRGFFDCDSTQVCVRVCGVDGGVQETGWMRGWSYGWCPVL